MGYQLDGVRAKQDYEISGWKKEWANYLLVASVVLCLCTIFALAIRDSEIKQSQNQTQKRRKIRHCDVWGPQIIMTLVETIVNFASFTATLAGCTIVLIDFRVYLTHDQNVFKQTFFGKLVLGNAIYKLLSDKKTLSKGISAADELVDITIGFLLTVICFIICLTCQMMLRSQKFADKF